FSFQKQLPPERTQVKNLENDHENDAERGEGIRGHQAGLDHVQRDQDQRDNRSDKAEVKTGVEEMILVLQQLKFDPRRDVLAADFRQLDQAGGVNERLQDEEQQQGQQTWWIDKR